MLRGAVAALVLAGGAVGLLAMSSSNLAAFGEACTPKVSCFTDTTCENQGACDTCLGASFPLQLGACSIVAT